MLLILHKYFSLWKGSPPSAFCLAKNAPLNGSPCPILRRGLLQGRLLCITHGYSSLQERQKVYNTIWRYMYNYFTETEKWLNTTTRPL